MTDAQWLDDIGWHIQRHIVECCEQLAKRGTTMKTETTGWDHIQESKWSDIERNSTSEWESQTGQKE